jgi:carbonic anhydrase/acetyltransferase-like protein (isoleucine patch superfamily)
VILPHHGAWPKIHETAFVAPSADVVGEVEIGNQSSIWFQCVVRGDVNQIKIGERTNIQDQSVLHVTRKESERPAALTIGDDVTVGHRVVLHGCKVGNRVLIGMGAIIMDDAEIGDDCIIGAGSLVTGGTKIPSGVLAVGSPAKVSRSLKDEEMAFLLKSAKNYVSDAIQYRGYVHGPRKLDDNQDDLEFRDNDFDEGEV